MSVSEEQFTEHSTLHLILEGHELADVGGWFGSTDPFFMLQVPIETSSGSVLWQTIYTSTAIPSNLNPRWKKAQINLLQLCQNDTHKPIRIKVVDWEPSEKHNNMGYVDTSVADLLFASGDASKTMSLKDKEQDYGKLVIRLARIKTPRPDKVLARRRRDSSNSRRSTRSTISIRFDDTLLDNNGLSDRTALLHLTLEGRELTDVSGWFETLDPFFQICVPGDTPHDRKVVWQTVSRSRPIVDSLNPVWSEVSVSLYLLCGEECDLNKPFRVFVFDNIDGGKPTPMGYFESTVKEMMKAAKDDTKRFTLANSQGTEFGSIVVLHAQLPDDYSDSSHAGSFADEHKQMNTIFQNKSIPGNITTTDSPNDRFVDQCDRSQDSHEKVGLEDLSSSNHSESSRRDRKNLDSVDSWQEKEEELVSDSSKAVGFSRETEQSSIQDSSYELSSHKRRSFSLDSTGDEKEWSSQDMSKNRRESSGQTKSYHTSRSKSLNDSYFSQENRASERKKLKDIRRTLSSKSRGSDSEGHSLRHMSYKDHSRSYSFISEKDKEDISTHRDSAMQELTSTSPQGNLSSELSNPERETKRDVPLLVEVPPASELQGSQVQPLDSNKSIELHQTVSSDPERRDSGKDQGNASNKQVLRNSQSLTFRISLLEKDLAERDKLLDSARKEIDQILLEKRTLEVEVATSSRCLEDLRDARRRLEGALIDTKSEIVSYKRDLGIALEKLNDKELESNETKNIRTGSSSLKAPHGHIVSPLFDGCVSEGGSAGPTGADKERGNENAEKGADDDTWAVETAQGNTSAIAATQETIATSTTEEVQLSRRIGMLEQRLTHIEREADERTVADSREMVAGNQNSLLDRKTLETSLTEAQVQVQSYSDAIMEEKSKMRAINNEKRALEKRVARYSKVAKKNLATVQQAKNLLSKYKTDRKKASKKKASLKRALKEARASTQSHLKKWTEAKKKASKLEKSVESKNKVIKNSERKLKSLEAEKVTLESTISTLKDAGAVKQNSSVKSEGRGNDTLLETTRCTPEFLQKADKDALVSKIQELETHFEDATKQRQAAVTAKKLYEGFWKDAKERCSRLQVGSSTGDEGGKWHEFEEDPFESLPEVNFEQIGRTGRVRESIEKADTNGDNRKPKGSNKERATDMSSKVQRKTTKNANRTNPDSGTSAKARAKGRSTREDERATMFSNSGTKRYPATSEGRSNKNLVSRRRMKETTGKRSKSEGKKSRASTRHRQPFVSDSKGKTSAPVGSNVKRMSTARVRRTSHRATRAKRQSDIVNEQLKQQTHAATKIMEEDEAQLKDVEQAKEILAHSTVSREVPEEEKARRDSKVLEEVEEDVCGAEGDSIDQETATEPAVAEKSKRSYFSFGRRK